MGEIVRRPRIGIDLDKTLVEYDGWKGVNHIGPLLPGAFDFVKELSDEGWFIILFSARAEDEKARKILGDWIRVTFPFIPERQLVTVTNVKMREIECFVDDRAIPFWGDYEYTKGDLSRYVALKPDVQEALKEGRPK